MSLHLDFRSASGHAVSLLSTLDSRGLGSRPVYANEVPTPPVPPQDELLPVHSWSERPSPTPTNLQSSVDPPRRCHLPSAMTDLKLGMDPGSVPITPFCYFVAPELFTSPRVFHRFMDLPLEIHRIIFRFCDTPTLFHLMHTCSYSRLECLDLFWKFRDGNTWYRMDVGEHESFGQYPTVYDCPEFASRVTQVEIYVSHYVCGREAEFWKSFQDIFSSAQRVVFFDPCLGQWSFTRIIQDHKGENYAMSELMALVPPNITAFVATPREGKGSGLRSRLWSMQGSRLSLVQDSWTPMRVVLPPRRVRPGILNYFLTSGQLGRKAIREKYGAEWLTWKTYVLYADASGIDCPYPDCNRKFPNEGEWEWHLPEYHGRTSRNALKQGKLTYCRNTPAEVKAVLDEKQRRIDQANLMRRIADKELIQRYRQHGEQGTHRFKEALSEQLKEYGFSSYAGSLDQWELWQNFPSEWQDGWDDEPGYPEDYEVDSDQECPLEEDLDYGYVGEEYFVYPE